MRVRRPRARTGGGATMAEVARLAGLSVATVSRALREPGRVAEETRSRVAEAVARSGYVPNRLAGALASGRSGVVGVVVPTLSTSFFGATVAGLEDALAPAGLLPLLGQSGYREASEARLVEAFLARRVDALVVTGTHHAPGTAALLAAQRVPVVEVWELPPAAATLAVGFDNPAAGAAVAEHLLAAGRRRIGCVGGADPRTRSRVAGFRARLEAAGLPLLALAEAGPPGSMALGAEALDRLLSEAPGLDAVFVNGDHLALGALARARALGRRVPQDLALVGFGGIEAGAHAEPGLTTLEVDRRRIGEEAGRLLTEALAGGPRAAVVDVGFRVLRRGSG